MVTHSFAIDEDLTIVHAMRDNCTLAINEESQLMRIQNYIGEDMTRAFLGKEKSVKVQSNDELLPLMKKVVVLMQQPFVEGVLRPVPIVLPNTPYLECIPDCAVAKAVISRHYANMHALAIDWGNAHAPTVSGFYKLDDVSESTLAALRETADLPKFCVRNYASKHLPMSLFDPFDAAKKIKDCAVYRAMKAVLTPIMYPTESGDGLVFAGGFCKAHFYTPALPYGDIDLFVVAHSAQRFKDLCKGFASLMRDSRKLRIHAHSDTNASITTMCRVCVDLDNADDFSDEHYTLQLIKKPYKDAASIIEAFDVGSCACGITRDGIVVNERFLYCCVNKMEVYAPEFDDSTRYVGRLLYKHCFRGGHDVYVPGITDPEGWVKLMDDMLGPINRNGILIDINPGGCDGANIRSTDIEDTRHPFVAHAKKNLSGFARFLFIYWMSFRRYRELTISYLDDMCRGNDYSFSGDYGKKALKSYEELFDSMTLTAEQSIYFNGFHYNPSGGHIGCSGINDSIAMLPVVCSKMVRHCCP